MPSQTSDFWPLKVMTEFDGVTPNEEQSQVGSKARSRAIIGAPALLGDGGATAGDGEITYMLGM